MAPYYQDEAIVPFKKNNGFKVVGITYDQCKDWLLHKHYAHRIPSISHAFGLYDKANNLVGIMTFGKPASYTLCEGICGSQYKDIVIELNRLVVNDGLMGCASYFIARALRLLPKPSIVVSYADPNHHHHGYVYQATNWIYTGLSSRERNYLMKTGEIITTRRHIDTKGTVVKTAYQLPKHRYVYFCGTKKYAKEMKAVLKYPTQPYPKGDNQRYDASYQPGTQGLLM